MNNKLKLVAISVTLTALIACVFALGFYRGMDYVRNANLHIDVGTGYCAHIQVWVTRVDGTTELIKDGVALNNAGTLTNCGKDFLEGKISDSSFANGTEYADDISVSTSSSSPSATWDVIPSEITTDGLDRHTGTYSSTGVGQWTVSYQFTASGTHTDVQLTGLNWGAADEDKSLLASDTFTAVTLNNGDKLTVTWTVTVS